MADRTCALAGCERPWNKHAAHGLCRVHYGRLLKHGETGPADGSVWPPRLEVSLADRFWAKVDRRGPDDCWPWTRSLDKGGYGKFKDGPNDARRTKSTHRLAYELLVGPIPEGLVIDHLCRNRRCCNPAHMEPVTNAENIRRGMVGKMTAIPSPDAARLYGEGWSLSQIAALYGMHRQTIAYRLKAQGVTLRPRGRAPAR